MATTKKKAEPDVRAEFEARYRELMQDSDPLRKEAAFKKLTTELQFMIWRELALSNGYKPANK